MSPSIKLGLMTLVSAAAAVPHYGGHSKFHKKPTGGYSGPGTASGAPYPTGSSNETAPYPSGSGAGYGSQPTTTLINTEYSTQTEYSTIYATSGSAGGAGGSAYSVGAQAISTGAGAVCGGTVTVTATSQVTVTVGGGAGGYSAASSSYAEASSAPASSAPAYSAPAGGYGASSVPVVSVSLPGEQKSYSKAIVPSAAGYSAPAYSAPAVSSAPVSSAPAYSAPASSVAKASSSVVASSTKPSSTGSSYSGGKRGCAYNDASLCGAFNEGNFGWAFNWVNEVQGELPSGVTYIPCPNDVGYLSSAETWLGNVDTAVSAGSEYVFSWNEPDINGQTASDIATLWDTWYSPIKSSHPSVSLVAPSVTNSQNAGQGVEWLESFLSAMESAGKKSEIGAVNCHWYDYYSDSAVDNFKTEIAKCAATGYKVWVTEYALLAGATDEQVASFMSETMEWMEGNSDILGYAWLMVGPASANAPYGLVTGSDLNTYGNSYNS